MVTQENLKRAGPFISRLPATYNECERAILSAIDADQWQEIGRIALTSPTKNRPVATYRVHEETVTFYDQEYRAVVVHSSAHDGRRQKRLERELGASLKATERNFGFLKDAQIVNAIFLKQPERIEALGLILLISLLIWRLIEHAMRTDLEARDTTVPGWDSKS